MILGIGIDSIEIERFTHWHTFDKKRLARIFSTEETAYCLESTNKTAERFAARFAAREAFFKALSSAIYPEVVPFLTVCKAMRIERTNTGIPQCIVDWHMLKKFVQKSTTVHLSLTHTRLTATALVALEQG